MSNLKDFVGGGGIGELLAFNDISLGIWSDKKYNSLAVDAGQGDGSYITSIANNPVSSISYFSKTDVLQWSIVPSEVFGTATNFIRGSASYIDGTTLYVIADGSTSIQLGSVDMSTGVVTPIGSMQVLVASYTDLFQWHKKDGNVIKYYSEDVDENLTVDVSTGVFTEVVDQLQVGECYFELLEGIASTAANSRLHTFNGPANLSSKIAYNSDTVDAEPFVFGDRVYFKAGNDSGSSTTKTDYLKTVNSQLKALSGSDSLEHLT